MDSVTASCIAIRALQSALVNAVVQMARVGRQCDFACFAGELQAWNASADADNLCR